MFIRTALIALLIAACAAFALGCNKAGQQQQQSGQSSPAQTEPESSVTPETAVKAPSESDRPLLIWTDPAMAPVLQELSESFKAQYEPGFSLAFLDKGELLLNLQNFKDGTAPKTPDIYVFTGQEMQKALVDAGAIDDVSMRSCAGDRLVLVSRQEDTYQSNSLFDVHKLRFKQLALADPAETMLGVYSDQAIITDGLKPRIEDRLTTLGTSDELVDGVQDKSLDIAIVYGSRAAQTPGLRLALVVDESLHEDIVWKAAASSGRSADPAVMKLLAFLAEDEEVQKQYEAFGYTRREVAMVEEK
ncbi:substrate-binding domain-containing protein [bacterium]|nr:substrate-binding domain-containing protein [bacterium]